MDELKLLVDMVAGLPQMALWVIAAFFAYKVIVIGSLYGIIRFAIDRAHSWLMQERFRYKYFGERDVHGICVTHGTQQRLLMEIRRLIGKRVGISTEYIHGQSVDWLHEAIDEKMERDAAAKPKSAA